MQFHFISSFVYFSYQHAKTLVLAGSYCIVYVIFLAWSVLYFEKKSSKHYQVLNSSVFFRLQDTQEMKQQYEACLAAGNAHLLNHQ